MNALNGLDGKSVAIGGGLVLAGLVAIEGGLFPVLLIGGFVYFMGTKKGWWGHNGHQPGSEMMRHRGHGGPPFFAEWHRQAHAADAAYASQTGPYQPAPPAAPGWTPASDPAAPQAPIWQPQAPAPTPATAPASAQPQDVEVRIPVTIPSAAPVEPPAAPQPPAPEADYRRTVGDGAAPVV